VDPTLLVPLNSLASQLSTATTTTSLGDVSHLLDYCSTHPESTIRYYAYEMQLKIHSDASYLYAPKDYLPIGGYFYLGIAPDSPATPFAHGPLLCHTPVLKHVISSVAEADFAAAFVNAKEDTITRTTIYEMDHEPQSLKLTTSMQTESLITQSNKSAPKPWTCFSNGSKTGLNKTNSI
jgi:hypothetical protein